MERTVNHAPPGRWMPIVWLLFAVALTVGIIAIIQNTVPIDPKDEANATDTKTVTAEADGPVARKTASPSLPVPSRTSPAAEVAPIERPPGEDIDPPTEAMEAAPIAAPSGAVPAALAHPSGRPPRFTNGMEVKLVQTVPAETRDGDRVTGMIYLQPGTSVVVEEAKPDGAWRISWRNAEAIVADEALSQPAE